MERSHGHIVILALKKQMVSIPFRDYGTFSRYSVSWLTVCFQVSIPFRDYGTFSQIISVFPSWLVLFQSLSGIMERSHTRQTHCLGGVGAFQSLSGIMERSHSFRIRRSYASATFQSLSGIMERSHAWSTTIRHDFGKFQSLSGIMERSHLIGSIAWIAILSFNPFQGLWNVLTCC